MIFSHVIPIYITGPCSVTTIDTSTDIHEEEIRMSITLPYLESTSKNYDVNSDLTT